MKKSTKKNLSPEQQPSNEPKADEQQVSPAIGNTNVVRSLVKVQDLRIGNFVYGVNEYQGTALPICSLHSDNTLRLLVGEKSIGCFSANQINPIELDISWLEFFGFKKDEDAGNWHSPEHTIYSAYGFSVGKKDDYIGWYNSSEDDFYSSFYPQIKYVHQLQNLYFVLVGKELEPAV